ncbi:GDSL-type esterase/lipase family protein [uncultured Paenibacillus sp.]|uniref:GDSL-type esterase/lipase family protein n=1 Tax=uncultured Paenibacillus sp. TaxID=227322 RepID=UPI0015AD0F1A|nr:GDSL-type esterase/lipase family protein [uncultured Paenibacillus sp.]
MKKILEIGLAGMIVCSLAACGGQSAGKEPTTGQPASSGQTLEETSAGIPQSKLVALFHNSVFLGDSITEGLAYHEVLAEENVLAGAGKTAEFAMGDMDELTKRNPKHIFIQLGSDDILWPTDHPQEYAIGHYTALIETIKQKLPQAKITVLSVTPVTEEALGKEPRYQPIPDFNEKLKEMAAKEQVAFADLSAIFANHPDLYDTDGIHFKPEFYPLMLEALKEQVE